MGLLTVGEARRISSMRALYAGGEVMSERRVMRRACAEELEPAMLSSMSDSKRAKVTLGCLHGQENLLDEIVFGHAIVDVGLHHVVGSRCLWV